MDWGRSVQPIGVVGVVVYVTVTRKPRSCSLLLLTISDPCSDLRAVSLMSSVVGFNSVIRLRRATLLVVLANLAASRHNKQEKGCPDNEVNRRRMPTCVS